MGELAAGGERRLLGGVNRTKEASIVWFRQDLRLEDNPALGAAVATGGPVLAVFIWDEAGEGAWAAGGASRWWWWHSLTALGRDIAARGGRLILRRGRAEEVLPTLVAEMGAGAVYWNRRYEPAVIARDARLKSALKAAGVEAKSFNGALLLEPHTLRNKQGTPFKVFTPFWRYCLTQPMPEVIQTAPVKWPGGAEELKKVASEDLGMWGLLPTIPWDAEFGKEWTPGETGARAALAAFVAEGMTGYEEERNRPDRRGTSRLSAHLHFGEISPRQVWAAVKATGAWRGVFPPSNGARVFLSEIGWREFAHHLLYHYPDTPAEPLRPEFKAFPWREDAGGELLRAWQRGRTGYPIVDAGMRELWATGWMHNRVRMIVASFLVKHLRLPWQAGAAWFWDTLVDADLASNTLGWQWSAGCGADAAPYFRIFAPVLQGEKFDPAGDYVRRWVPEIARLPNKYLHKPWEAPAEFRERCGVDLGGNYPEPVVDHGEARAAALAALKTLRGGGGPGEGADAGGDEGGGE